MTRCYFNRKDVLPRPKYAVKWLDDGETKENGCSSELADRRPAPFAAPLVSCERLTPAGHFQDVRLVEVELAGWEGRTAYYRPGDVAVLQPANLREHVDTFFSLLPALSRDKRFRLEQLDPNIPLPPR